MKLIIDISEGSYNTIKECYERGELLTTICMQIATGTPYKERPQGEWKVNNYGEHICPICGHYALYDECQDNDYYEVQSNFCPNCGAKMASSEKTQEV